MTTSFDNRVKILGNLFLELEDYPQLKDYFAYHNLTGTYCAGVRFGHITLTAKGIEEINESWYNLLTMLDKPDMGFQDEFDLFPLEEELLED